MNFSKDSLDVTLRDEVEISQEQGNPSTITSQLV
jgi:hypothetical protein